ncbi:flagellar assembly protein FliH [Cereibacter azotoformans]|uniref:Flagellar assembly protein FliH/Type III secretion system HrpE domain-containing protein n=1 Tax=Cereibacter sphaeroides (strain ATCC 17025 / ATH 2.4.3) TaxID=349102 RepID=A4WT22_CERS5|nr:FliH/SctL family protein [Cereibacter azotoformans]ULB09839.1 flagellar assembly protein FliH [Cereibacter azotoformans]
MNARTPMGPEDVLALIRESNARGFGRSAVPVRAPAEPFRPTPLAGLVRDVAPEGAALPVLEPEPPAPPAPALPDPVPPDPALLEAARAEGRREGHAEGLAEGRAAGRAEAEAALSSARDTFLQLAARLSAPTPADTARLAQLIEGAVRALASQRAGLAIDAHPEAFAARIETLADRVAQGLREVTLRLNAEDLRAVAPHLEAGGICPPTRITADPRLARGDLEVRAEGIVLADLIGVAPLAAAPRRDPETAPADAIGASAAAAS